MAWYTSITIWYRGRRVEVTERYGVFHNAHVLSGKPLRLRSKDIRRIEQLSLRGKVRKELDQQAEEICHPCISCPHR